MLPDEPTDEERQEELPQDNGTPFQAAAPNPDPAAGVVNDPPAQAASDSTLDDTHPVTDTNVQPEEQYDEGVSGAAEAQEPNAGNAVNGFTPPADNAGSDGDDQQAASSDSDDVVVG
jgi:hypothetical protein